MLVIEALQALAMKAKDIGMISSFEVSADKLVVTHFQYAGDTHFQKKKTKYAGDTVSFSSAKSEEVATLKRTLRCFHLSTGLKINLSKSMLVGVGCSGRGQAVSG